MVFIFTGLIASKTLERHFIFTAVLVSILEFVEVWSNLVVFFSNFDIDNCVSFDIGWFAQ